MSDVSAPLGPDLVKGISLDDVPDGHMMVGHVGPDAVLVAHHGNEFFAVGATCTHYGGPLVDGLMEGETVRCPWHHACFNLRTGEALRPPALSPLACWAVERRSNKIFVQSNKKLREPDRRRRARAGQPEKIVIVGGGAAGFAAAEKLRREQWQGSLVLLSDMMRHQSIDQICPRTISLAPPRRTGFRCGPQASMPRTALSCG